MLLQAKQQLKSNLAKKSYKASRQLLAAYTSRHDSSFSQPMRFNRHFVSEPGEMQFAYDSETRVEFVRMCLISFCDWTVCDWTQDSFILGPLACIKYKTAKKKGRAIITTCVVCVNSNTTLIVASAQVSKVCRRKACREFSLHWLQLFHVCMFAVPTRAGYCPEAVKASVNTITRPHTKHGGSHAR